MAFLTLSACGGYYVSNPGPGVPPTLISAKWTNRYEDGNSCGMAVMVDGSVGLISKKIPVVGDYVAAWLGFVITEKTGITPSIAECWHVWTNNYSNSIQLLTQCYGQPTLRTTWDDIGAAMTWISIPFCQCNQTCQGMANQEGPVFTRIWWDQYYFCRQWPLSPACDEFWGRYGASAMTQAQPTGTDTSQPLPAGWDPVPYDVTTPVPEH